MNKLRRERSEDNQHLLLPQYKPLRIVAAGTLFLTHTISVPCHPIPSSEIRAHSVEKVRGGSANMILSVLAQFPAVESVLVASLGGNEEGRMILRDLENEGIVTKFCKIWRDAGVPNSWVLYSAEDNSRMVVHHNPLPDITHEDFVSLLGPLLAPENFPPAPTFSPTNSQYGSSTTLSPPSPNPPRPSMSGSRSTPTTPILSNPNSPAPFDWLHFEGRTVKTTLSNITGLDGLARERKWRSHCVFSLDVGRRSRQGVEALIPHADVLFFNKQYAEANSPHYEVTPRAFLLSMAAKAAPHALLVAYWGREGGAVLSLPTREYFQSSAWVEDMPPQGSQNPDDSRMIGQFLDRPPPQEIRSVRSGSVFWADGRSRTPSSQAFTSHASQYMSDGGYEESDQSFSRQKGHNRQAYGSGEYTMDEDNDSEGTETPSGAGGPGRSSRNADGSMADDVGAQDAFIAGMIYALSRRICPGLPFTPAWTGEEVNGSMDDGRAKWRLDECLRFATELSGRKARRKATRWNGLADEMTQGGWFEN
ncbi:hypothetical protein CPB83DRAFT_844555 [Crepidotus variabilis]|uniref:Carbohydrate kinase PfkB domain-containing protein n=1 Tax=Crepidotus variabilis TaxID=179855 RepID=A0A9P6ERH5_9AGAR|nr:hypothetical protein CPB83DRAFT_844555 [Crepidotus variabilis]